MIEIMAPAGSFETLHTAINAGADSIYFGVGNLNMRSRAANFQPDDLPEIVTTCRASNIKSYLALNTVMYDDDLNESYAILKTAKVAGITAIIATDMAIVYKARELGLRVHMSTQANISNTEAVRHYSRFADVMVLARELTIDQIKSICDSINKQRIKGPSGNLVKIEAFIHGALCVSIAGKCYMSLATYNQSANRGACLQNCRRAYKLEDTETGDSLELDNKYVMSPADLCTIGMLDKLANAGVEIFKIEGRGRKADYVHKVVSVYKQAFNAVQDGTYNKEMIRGWKEELAEVYNRGFWDNGYYMGKSTGEWSGTYGSKATKKKVLIGKVLNYYAKKKVCLFKLESGQIREGDELMITGRTTGLLAKTADELMVADKSVKKAEKGEEVTFRCDKVRKNDKVYLVEDRN